MSSLLTILAASEPRAASAPSNYQADVRVEIAWNAGARMPASLYTWTDVSPYVELADEIDMSWGRQDERSNADPNQCRLVFDNSDGRFTAGKTTGPYGSKVLLDRPIRVIIDPVDGTEVEYFRGYVNEWPTEWNGTDAYAKATVTASSRLSRLGLQAKLRSIIETELFADGPIAYYPLGEPSGATQVADVSGHGADPLQMVGDGTPVEFGSATGPGTDGLTAATFALGQYLTGPPPAIADAPCTLECFFSTTSGASVGIFNFGTTTNAVPAPELLVVAGNLVARVGLAAQIVSAADVNDGATHHAAMTVSGGTLTLYLDGVSAGTVAYGSGPTFEAFEVGTAAQGARFDGVIAHAAAFGTALSSTRIAAHAAAGVTGYAGETTDARLVRYAGYAGIPAAEVNAEAGSTTMAHVDTSGKNVVELFRVCEATEGGVLYDARDGRLTMHNRAHRYVVSSAYTLNMAEQEVEQGYAPKYDRTGLANDVTASNIAGTISARRIDQTSVDDYGAAILSVETASENPDEPRNMASWLLYKFKDPKERVPSLTIDCLAQVGKTPNCSAVLATTVGTKITVSNRPTQAATSSVDYFVEGGNLKIGPERMTLTLNLSPSSPEDTVLIIGDPVRGAIGVNPIAW